MNFRFTHSGMVRTCHGTVKIYFSPQNNINELTQRRWPSIWRSLFLQVCRNNREILQNSTIGVISFSCYHDDNTLSVELKELSKIKNLTTSKRKGLMMIQSYQ